MDLLARGGFLLFLLLAVVECKTWDEPAAAPAAPSTRGLMLFSTRVDRSKLRKCVQDWGWSVSSTGSDLKTGAVQCFKEIPDEWMDFWDHARWLYDDTKAVIPTLISSVMSCSLVPIDFPCLSKALLDKQVDLLGKIKTFFSLLVNLFTLQNPVFSFVGCYWPTVFTALWNTSMDILILAQCAKDAGVQF